MNSLFQSFYQLLDASLSTGINSVVASGLAYAAKPLHVLLVIYIGIIGYLGLTGQADEPFRLLVIRVVKASFVVYLLTASAYDTYVRGLFMTGIPNAIAQALNAGTSVTTAPQQFDSLWSATMHQCAAVLQEATGITNIGTRITVYVAQGLIGIALGLSFIIWEMARALMGIVICLGPFMLAFYLFQATRSLVERWLGKLIALTVLQLCVSVLLQILLQGQKSYMMSVQTSVGGSAGLDEQVMVLLQIGLFFAMCAFLMVMLPSIAYSIGSGISFSTSGVVGMPQRLARQIMGRL
jgi:type IV secretory pathway VirB6-like protein